MFQPLIFQGVSKNHGPRKMNLLRFYAIFAEASVGI